MKPILTSIAAGGLLAGLAMAQPPRPRYTVTDLGTLPGGTFSQAYVINNPGAAGGAAAVQDGTQHAVLWQGGKTTDITASGLGGPNSAVFGVNDSGQVEGQAETSAKDPNNENFCAYSTGFTCVGFLWQNGQMIPLPTLGGYNATVGTMNSRGEVAGTAETGIRDANCTTGVTFDGTGPQVLDFEAVIWGPAPGQIRELHPLPGDTVGMALSINDSGQAVGASGSCSNTQIPPIAFGPHAVFWDSDGSVTDIGNLGGTPVNIALSINNQGQVTGVSSLSASTTPAAGHDAFLWSKQTGMRDLGTLPGDVGSVGTAVNDSGQVVGESDDAMGNPRAILWQNGAMSDLNTLVPAGSPLFLLCALAINSSGQIAGFGVTSTGDVHAYLATPARTTAAVAGPKGSTVITRQYTLDGTASTSVDGKPLTYLWTIPQGQGNPSAAILQGTTATPTIQFGQTRGVYTFQLTVTDSTGTSASDVVTVNYQGN